MSEKQTGGVAAVERALSLLNVFRTGDTALSLHDLSERSGLYKSTILRLLSTLTEQHCIQRLDDGRYQLGPALLHWGNLYLSSLQLDDHVIPILQRLVTLTGEGASFFIREGDVRICLFRVDSNRSIRDHIRAGDMLPLDKGAAARVLCGFDPLLKPGKVPASPVVVTIGEREPDIAAVSVPVFGPGSSLRGALAVSGPCARFDEAAIARISEEIVGVAIELTRRLGGDASVLSEHSRKWKDV